MSKDQPFKPSGVYNNIMRVSELEEQLAAVTKERDELLKDKARLDYLPKHIYFGKMTAREAIDKAMSGEEVQGE